MPLSKEDEDLVMYCRLHCRTERALFHVSDINRMLVLAGEEPLDEHDGFYSIHDYMEELCRAALDRYGACGECGNTGIRVANDSTGTSWKETCPCRGLVGVLPTSKELLRVAGRS